MTGWHVMAIALAIWALAWSTVEREKNTAQLEIAKLHCVVKP